MRRGLSPKAGVGIGVFCMVVYAGIMMSRPDPEEIARRFDERASGRDVREASAAPDEPSYALRLNGTAGGMYGSALRRALADAMGQPIRFEGGDDEGELGTIDAWLDVEERQYRGTGRDANAWAALPVRIELSLTIESAFGTTSDWDGTHEASVEERAPSSIRVNDRSRLVEQRRARMMRALIDQIRPG